MPLPLWLPLQEFDEYDEETEGMRAVRRDASLADNALLPGALRGGVKGQGQPCSPRTCQAPAPCCLAHHAIPLRSAAAFFERQGERLYRGLVEGFRGVQYGGPPPCPPGAPTADLLAGVQQILDIYAAQGYALKATVAPGDGGAPGGKPTLSPVGGGGGSGGEAFTVKLEGPANLWSLQVGGWRQRVLGPHAPTCSCCCLRLGTSRHACRLTLPLPACLQALASRRSSLFSQHDAAAVAAFLRASGRSSTCRLSWSDTAVVQQWSLA